MKPIEESDVGARRIGKRNRLTGLVMDVGRDADAGNRFDRWCGQW